MSESLEKKIEKAIRRSERFELDMLQKVFSQQGAMNIDQSDIKDETVTVEKGYVIIGSLELKAAIEIAMPPGIKMTDWAEIIFSKKTVERVFEPLVADYQKDHIEALASGARKMVLRGIMLRYWAAYILAFLYEIFSQIGRLIKAIRGAG